MAQFAVRRQDASGDMQFGHGLGDFYVDQPEAVGQVVYTRIRMFQGEWYLDLSAGTPWIQQMLGKSSPTNRDSAMRMVILQSPFVTGLSNWSSTVDSRTRNWTVGSLVKTAFGQIPIAVPFTAQPSGQFQIGYSPLGSSQGVG